MHIVTSRTNYAGTENHWSDGTVTCRDPDGVPTGCNAASVAAQQGFAASIAETGGVLPGVPTYRTVMDNYGEIMAYYPSTPDPRASLPIQVYSRTTPQAGQPVGSYPGYNFTPIVGGGSSGYSTGDALSAIGALGYAGCLTKFSKTACDVALAAYTLATGNSGGGSNAGSSLTNTCPAGMVKDASGACVGTTNGGGGVPVGQIATPADVHAVMGLYGAAVTPFQIGNIGGNPILRCPVRGMVLGRDGLCYNKRDLRKDERKWAPARRPPMTGAEAHTLRTVGTLKKRAKKLAQLAGFAVGARGRSPARPKGRK